MTGRGEVDAVTAPAPADAGGTGVLPVLTSVIRRRWTASVFGIVAPGAIRRRPSDVIRIVVATVVLVATAVGADTIGSVEADVFDLVSALPDGLTGMFELLFLLAPIVAAVLVVSALVARRPRLLLTLLLASALAGAVAALLSGLVDVTDALQDAGVDLAGEDPNFPVVMLSVAMAVLLAARPSVTRPARRMVETVLWLSALAAVYLAEGLPISVLATLVLGWGAAAAAHLALGVTRRNAVPPAGGVVIARPRRAD